MKTVLFLMLSFSCLGQLEEVKQAETLYQDMQLFEVTRLDSTYKLFFKDRQYEYIVRTNNLKFNGMVELNQFFDFCLDAIETGIPHATENYSIRKGLGNAVIYKGSAWFYISKKKITKIKSKL